MTYEFDEGSNSGGAAIGPFLNWHAQETRDGIIPSRSFSVRDENGDREDVTAKMKKGVVFDLNTLKTGWCFSDGTPGVAPEWVFNDTPARFNVAQPDDRGTERWKKGFSVRVATGKDEAATWSQAGAGAWAGLVHLMKAVKADGGDGECVVAALSDVETNTFKKGGTSAPIFIVTKWAARPECLVETPVAEEAARGNVDEFVDEF
jgi:hypothetical protein